eukprot:15431712-Alexandrium_andersonii.AAC.1
MPYHVMSSHVVSCRAMPCHVMSRNVFQRNALQCNVLRRYVEPSDAIDRIVMFCSVVQCSTHAHTAMRHNMVRCKA